MAKFKYVVTTPKYSMHEEITMTLNSENSLYISVQNLASFRSCLPVYRLNFAELQFCLLFYMGVIFCLSFWVVKVFENWVMSRTYRSKLGLWVWLPPGHAYKFAFFSVSLSWLGSILEQGRSSAQEILLIFMNKLNIIHFPCNYII